MNLTEDEYQILVDRANNAELTALAPDGNGSTLPEDNRTIFVAWQWPGGIGYSVGTYWYTEDSPTEKVLTDDEGFTICSPAEVLAWWQTDRFDRAARAYAASNGAMLAETDEKITHEEFAKVFGDSMPVEIATILFDNTHQTVLEARRAINRELVKRRFNST